MGLLAPMEQGKLPPSAFFGAGMLALAGVGMWTAAEAVMEEPLPIETIINAAVVYYPALLVMIGLAVFFMGFKPKLLGLAWLYLGYSFLVLYLGELLDIPEEMAAITPFGHIPQLPIEEMNYSVLVILTAIALLLVIFGIRGYQQRDIE